MDSGHGKQNAESKLPSAARRKSLEPTTVISRSYSGVEFSIARWHADKLM
jgi:hypothetical protein